LCRSHLRPTIPRGFTKSPIGAMMGDAAAASLTLNERSGWSIALSQWRRCPASGLVLPKCACPPSDLPVAPKMRQMAGHARPGVGRLTGAASGYSAQYAGGNHKTSNCLINRVGKAAGESGIRGLTAPAHNTPLQG